MNMVLLTKFYPYGTGEAFIENEVNVISKYYDKILIIACEAPNTDTIRNVPANVVVRKVSGTSTFGKLRDTIKGQLKNKRNNEFKEEKKNCKTIKQKAFLGYFEEKSQRIYRTIIKKDLLEGFSQKPFVLYSYWLFVTARVANIIQQNFKVSYAFSRAHRYDLYAEKNNTNYLPYRKLFLNSFNKVFPCSDNGMEYLQTRYPEYKEKIETSLLGTLDYGSGIQSADGVFRIVSCSRIAPEKRVERIVDSLAILDSKGLNIEWTHIGGGAKLDDIKKRAEKQLQNIQYTFLGDTPNKQVMQLYKTKPFDMFLNISSSEGLPVSIMEAISFGMPVIATDVGGTNEIVITEKTGYLLPENFKNEELSEVINWFYNLSKTNEYKKYRLQCRKYWEQHFKAEENYNKLYRYIEEDRTSSS